VARVWAVGGALVVAAILAIPVHGAERGSLVRVSHDPFDVTRSEVEPATFAYGHTVVSAFQVGRLDAGAVTIGFAASDNNAMTWRSGLLRGTTAAVGGRYERGSDPSVAYDTRTRTWLVGYLGLSIGGPFQIPTRSAVQVVRSEDGAGSFGVPITVAKAPAGIVYDKPWVTCDNETRSPFRGRCYAVWDELGLRGGPYGRVLLSTSRNGGKDWSAPVRTAGVAHGFGGIPVVRPDGTVVVPYLNTRHPFHPSFDAFRSTDGGRHWTRPVLIADRLRVEPEHHVVRDPGLPSVAVDAFGTIYVAWSDCRFRSRCSTNDIVLATSRDGRHWTDPQRIASSGASPPEHLLTPGLTVRDRGRHIDVALTYYALSRRCSPPDCSLVVRYSSSRGGIQEWSRPVALSSPMRLDRFAPTFSGYMWGDYITTATLGNGRAVMVLPLAKRRAGDSEVAMYAPLGGLEIGRPTFSEPPVEGAPVRR
jgi:hypothetical protein